MPRFAAAKARTTRGGNMEAFMKWIEDEINPIRRRIGLCAIGYDEQVRCYEILQAFHAKMNGTPNTDFNLTTDKPLQVKS
jgi:hypothetical protein